MYRRAGTIVLLLLVGGAFATERTSDERTAAVARLRSARQQLLQAISPETPAPHLRAALDLIDRAVSDLEHGEENAALDHVREAKAILQEAVADKGAHREKALHLVNDAITNIERGIAYDRERPFTIVRVYYGTNRTRIPNNRIGFDYDARQTALSLGTATVSIPEDHRLGQWERPLIETFASQRRDVMILTITPQPTNEFTARLKESVGHTQTHEALVFVHGYNTSFQDALQRTALIAYDLKFGGVPIAFTWPSKATYRGYPADEDAAQSSVEDLVTFLQLVAKESGATRIHLIAHSMGNRILLQALRTLQDRQQQPTNLAHLVLAAPDVSVTYFSQLVGPLTTLAQRITLYASSKDKALHASHDFHTYQRAGEAGTSIVLLDHLDSVDVSAINTGLIGHSYFGDNRSVITDMHELITNNSPPAQRVCLSARERDHLPYWVFDRCK